MFPGSENEQGKSEDTANEDEQQQQASPKSDVTDVTQATSQTGSDDTNNDEDDDVDPIEVYKQTFEKTMLDKLRAEALEKARTEYAAEQAARQQQEQAELVKKQLEDSFENSIKESREAALKLQLRDEDGNPIKLSDEEFQSLVQPWQKHNTKVNQLAEGKIYADVAAAINALVPASQREEFVKRAHNKPLNEYFSIFAELRAEETQIVKTLKADHEVEKKAAEASGYAKGQRQTGKGTPKQGNERTISSQEKPDLTSLKGAAQALMKGQISEKDYLEIFNNYGKG